MKKRMIFLSLALMLASLFTCAKAEAWDSETGSGVVSAQESIVRTSLEAILVLQSDTLTNLYGVTILGGASNYASFDGGGVLRFNNVVSSVDVVKMNQNQFIAWTTAVNGNLRRTQLGVSADGTLTANNFSMTQAASANTLAVSGLLRASGDSMLAGVSATTARISSTLAVSGTTTLVGSLALRKSTVAGLPAVSSAGSYIQLVTDATTAGDCTTGGSNIMNLCMTSGSGVWIDA